MNSVSSDRELAVDPGTDPEVLRGLADVYPREVAGNAGAPVRVLARLASSFPDEVAGNPMVALSLLTDKGLFKSMTLNGFQYLLASRQAGEELVATAWQYLIETMPRISAGVIQGFLANPRTPASVLVELRRYVKKQVKEMRVTEVDRHRNMPGGVVPSDARGELVGYFERMKLQGDVHDVFAHTPLPDWVFEALARKNAQVVAASPFSSEEVLFRLASTEDKNAFRALLAREDLSREMYWVLEGRIRKTSLLMTFLRNPVVPADVVAAVTRRLGPRLGLAGLTHPNMTLSQLDLMLAEKKPPFPRQRLLEARNVVVQAEVERPAKRVAENRWGSGHSLHQVEYLQEGREYHLLTLVACAPELHRTVALALARTPATSVRLALAVNPNTPEVALECLRDDGDLLIARAAER